MNSELNWEFLKKNWSIIEYVLLIVSEVTEKSLNASHRINLERIGVEVA